jgi:hypothetical protein
MGLMQLMPSTARPLAKQLGVKKLEEKKLVTDPSFNVRNRPALSRTADQPVQRLLHHGGGGL